MMDEKTYAIGEYIYWEDCKFSGHPSEPTSNPFWAEGKIISEKQVAWGCEMYKLVDADGNEHYRRPMHIRSPDEGEGE